MKKSLVALAAFSAMSAFADVDVSGGIKLYGVLDQAFMNQEWKQALVNTKASSNNGFFGAGATSRFGIKGTRDLGDGIKGTVQVEMELAPDEAQVVQNKNRGTFVGLEKAEFGSIRLGTQETTAYEVFGMDVNGRVEYKPQVWRYTATDSIQDRANNAFKITSPEFKGFSVIYMRGYNEALSTAASTKDFSSWGVKYKSGAIQAAVVTDELNNTSAAYTLPGTNNAGLAGPTAVKTTYATTASADSIRRDIASVSYDMDFAKFNYIYADSRIAGKGQLNTNTIGVRVPVDKATFALSYGAGDYANAAATTKGEVSDTTFGAYYNFDKSTAVYLFYSNQTHNTGSQKGYTNTTALGAQYKF